MLTIFHNPRCAKSREALKIIQDEGAMVQVVEYLKTPPSTDELHDILAKLDMKPEELLRKNEKIFKENFKGQSYSDSEWIKIMQENPKLIERPIVIKDDKAVVGRPPEKVKELL